MSVNIEQRKKTDLRPGNTAKVWIKIKEGEKTRLQAFEGLIIAHKHGYEPGATFTIRKVASGVGVEKVFPVFSPNIDKIEITKRSKTRRAKLYYIRDKAAKQIRKKMKTLIIKEKEDEKIKEAKRLEEERMKKEVMEAELKTEDNTKEKKEEEKIEEIVENKKE